MPAPSSRTVLATTTTGARRERTACANSLVLGPEECGEGAATAAAADGAGRAAAGGTALAPEGLGGEETGVSRTGTVAVGETPSGTGSTLGPEGRGAIGASGGGAGASAGSGEAGMMIDGADPSEKISWRPTAASSAEASSPADWYRSCGRLARARITMSPTGRLTHLARAQMSGAWAWACIWMMERSLSESNGSTPERHS